MVWCLASWSNCRDHCIRFKADILAKIGTLDGTPGFPVHGRAADLLLTALQWDFGAQPGQLLPAEKDLPCLSHGPLRQMLGRKSSWPILHLALGKTKPADTRLDACRLITSS
jgi:hypothetical protein